jgi:hypothetical protein
MFLVVLIMTIEIPGKTGQMKTVRRESDPVGIFSDNGRTMNIRSSPEREAGKLRRPE